MLKMKSKKRIKKALLGGSLSFVGCAFASIALPYLISGSLSMLGGKIGVCFTGAVLIFFITYIDLTNMTEL